VVHLAIPDLRFHRSFLETVDEFRAAGEARYDGVVHWPAEGGFPGVMFTRPGLEDEEEFRRLVDNRTGDALPSSPRPPGWCPTTHWWMEAPDVADRFVGSISLRHNISHPRLATVGGHVGYAVRPSARRSGFATDALRQVVARAGPRGIPRLLVTCDSDNLASATVIERCGGVFEGELQGKRRYWIDATPVGGVGQ
jgi:predicted acetyltransferase